MHTNPYNYDVVKRPRPQIVFPEYPDMDKYHAVLAYTKSPQKEFVDGVTGGSTKLESRELSYSKLVALLHERNTGESSPGSAFLDVGSGRGHALLFASLFGNQMCIGVEVDEERSGYGQTRIKGAISKGLVDAAKIKLHHMDICDVKHFRDLHKKITRTAFFNEAAPEVAQIHFVQLLTTARHLRVFLVTDGRGVMRDALK